MKEKQIKQEAEKLSDESLRRAPGGAPPQLVIQTVSSLVSRIVTTESQNSEKPQEKPKGK